MIKKSARIIAFTLAAMLLLAACGKPISNDPGSSGSTSDPQTGGSNAPTVLTIAQGTDVEAWSPYAHSTTTTYAVWSNMLEPLVRFDFEKREVVGILAESWSVADDNLTWTIKLKQGIKFHDGGEFTSADVIHSFNRIKNDSDSLQASNLRNVVEMNALDDYTVELVTGTPDATFMLRLLNRFITSKAAFDQYGSAEEADKHPVGTGPYKFVEWERGNRFVMEANPDYRHGPPGYDRLIYKPIPEASTRVTALESGQVDIINNVPAHEIDRLANHKDIKIVSTDSLRSIFLPMNPTFPPLDDQRVRQAIVQAIDIDSIIDNILEGQATKLTTSVNHLMFGYDPDHEPFPYDPENAKRLLAEAGYPDGFTLDLMSPNGRYAKDLEISQAIANMLSKVGIETTVRTPEWGMFVNDLESGALPFYLIGRGGAVDADELVAQYWETGVTKRTMYSNPELDALLHDARMRFDSSRLEALQKAVNYVYDDAAAVYLLVYKDNYGVRKGVDWQPRPDEYIIGYEAKPAN